MSVTTFLKGHFSEFDACKVIENMKKGKNWNENNKYYNMTDDEIKTLWKENGSKSSSLVLIYTKILKIFIIIKTLIMTQLSLVILKIFMKNISI